MLTNILLISRGCMFTANESRESCPLFGQKCLTPIHLKFLNIDIGIFSRVTDSKITNVCLWVFLCLFEIKTPQPLRNITFGHHAYQPSGPSTIKTIDHHTYQPTFLSPIIPPPLPSYLSAIIPIGYHTYQQSCPSPISHHPPEFQDFKTAL